jgi:hypothetical protein
LIYLGVEDDVGRDSINKIPRPPHISNIIENSLHSLSALEGFRYLNRIPDIVATSGVQDQHASGIVVTSGVQDQHASGIVVTSGVQDKHASGIVVTSGVQD